ncbi:hypothetical protein [Blastococcus sp. CT_GayMR16]|uniref:hypothetical protein n=1 Tax=Blastococcus sp. CT_GayMR16 TaxID=2559607 RepID=UPI001073190E|nr:hypothetical protein [Blastococcus sp. CT_GayMR16]TFV82849.1 hypothetical protein E4P38_21915 [Blastococcus sp. CT_GayMR16]
MPRVDREAVVPMVAGILVALSLLVRLWTASGGWFLRQDFLAAAAAAGLPVDVPGPPGAAALARVMASLAPMSWPAFVALELVGQLAVDLLLYGLLVQLFGRRPAVLLPLAVYLASSLPLVGGLWWSAALVQLPLQLALLIAVTGHVRHLRTGRTGAMAASALAVAVGLLFSTGMALVPLLLLVGTALWGTLAGSRQVWLAQGAAVAVGLAARALSSAGPPVDVSAPADNARDLLGTLMRTVLPGLVGGPWEWSPAVLPLAVPDPSAASATAAAVAVAAVILTTVLVHRGALRAWLLAAATTVVVLVSGAFSPTAAADPELPAGVVPPAVVALVAALGLALASLPVRGAPTVLRRRGWVTRGAGRRVLRWATRPALGAVAVTALGAGLLVSSSAFGQHWSDNAAHEFVDAARAGLTGRTDLVLVDAPVPEAVIPGALAPAHTTAAVLAGAPGLPWVLQEGESANQLTALDPAGRPQLAAVTAVSTSRTGPEPDCGWLVGADAADVPLSRATSDDSWIVKVSYFAGEANVVRVEAGDTVTGALVGTGLHDLYVQVSGSVDRVVLAVEDPARPICVGVVTVGRALPIPPDAK